MKRLSFLAILIVSLLVFASCQKGPFLSISGDRDHSFTAEGGTYTLAFTSNRDWFVSISEPWCTVSPSSGVAGEGETCVVVTCEPNVGYDARTCTVSVNIEGAKEVITIEQAAAEGLIISPSSFDLSNAAQEIEVVIQANVDYTVTMDSQSEKWITRASTKALSSNIIVFNIFENTGYEERIGHVAIVEKDGILKGEITIRQAQRDGLIVNTQEYVVSEDAQSLTIEVDANVQFEVFSEVEWIKHVETKALKASSVILNVSANESAFSRTGKLSIRQVGGDLASIITVTQQARPELKTENATCVSFFDATLNGRLTVESQAEIASDVWFLYSSSASSIEELKSDGVKVLATFTDNGLFTKELSGLSMATSYNYVACARVNGRDYYGDMKSFMTSDFSAVVTTKSATGIDFFTGQLNGSLSTQNTNDLTKDVWFFYSSTSSSLEQLVAEGIKAPSTLADDGEFSVSLTELNYGTEYYYVACAKVHDRSIYGDVKSFATSTFSATINTSHAISNKLYKASLSGSVMLENAETLTKSAGFVYSESSNSATFEQLVENGNSVIAVIDLENTFSTTLTGLKCGTQYNFVAWVKVYDKVFYGELSSFTSYALPEGAVDMGLSVAWASCNIDASLPEEIGGLYAWGETETKTEYGWATYKWGAIPNLKKYNDDSYVGVADGKTQLDPEDDVAVVKLGGHWRMPTKQEFKELIDNCTWAWVTYKGVVGYLITSKVTGNKIFLPTTNQTRAEYWSSSLRQRDLAYVLWIAENRKTIDYGSYRSTGLPVRAVTE